ncbi:G kinase-anchoring protein 1-like [Mytilus californianus]|uniref:G kinase-anchoring protein 1-like n=1 Tax=Mytilus californianus TaxID=6549 RepID=UPI0022478788|nr:G kinase-anchoring protein 1-like [Mytilus californianus]
MAKVEQSRFALLKIEDDDDEDNAKPKDNANKSNNQQSSNKKKNKKKKKAEQQQENDELKHLAFAKPGSNKQRNKQNGHSEVSDNQWKDWKKADQNYAAESYEKDLEQALLMSKMEFEQKKEVTKSFKDAGINIDEESTKEKKKKKKDKPQTMSLEEFNAGGKMTHSDELEHLSVHPSSKPETPVTEADPKFFSHVEGDVERILRKEKMQEEYQKQYAAEKVMTAKHQSETAKKDKEIEFLKATVKKLEEEFKQVKKRNKQLCVILAQGEMKEKAEVLMQVQQLSDVKDELTQQVQELTGELEKERSKVHSLKTELDKIKGHGTKHSGK